MGSAKRFIRILRGKTRMTLQANQYIPKQKTTDPTTLIYLHFSKKVAETSIICSKIHLSRTQVSLSLTWRVSMTSEGRQERGVGRPGFGLPGPAARLVVVVRPCHLLSVYFPFLGWIIRVLRSLSHSLFFVSQIRDQTPAWSIGSLNPCTTREEPWWSLRFFLVPKWYDLMFITVWLDTKFE